MNAIEEEVGKLSETEVKEILCYALYELETFSDCADCDITDDCALSGKFSFLEPPEITCQRQILKYLQRRVATLKLLNK